jgi:hypothetical protein
MNKMSRLIIVLFLGFLLNEALGQNILLLEKIGTPKKFTYQIGDFINVKTKVQHLRLKNELWSIEDSSVMIGTNYTVRFDDIKSVRRDLYFPKLLSRIMLIAGAGYITLDIVNSLLTGQQVYNPTALIIGGSLIGVGLVMIPLSHHNINIGFKWKIKVLKPL